MTGEAETSRVQDRMERKRWLEGSCSNVLRPPVPTQSTEKQQRNEEKRICKAEAEAEAIKYISIDIIESVLMCMNPKDAMRLSTLCKEWWATTPRYNPTMSKIPWLLNVASDACFFHNVLDENMSFNVRISASFIERLYICGSSHGWLVLQPHYNCTISLLNPFSRARLDLPTLDQPMIFLHMSSSPMNPDCTFLGRHIEKLYIWQQGDKSWNSERNVDVKYFRSVLSFQGQLYAFLYSHQHLVTFQVLPLRIKKMDVPPPMDTFDTSYYNMCLVESCEEILLVCFHDSLYNWVAKEVYVFRLDLKNKIWIKIQSLGGRTLFVRNNNQAISISGHEAKCYGNCIYLIHPYSEDVCIIERQSFKVMTRRPRSLRKQLWITPSLI